MRNGDERGGEGEKDEVEERGRKKGSMKGLLENTRFGDMMKDIYGNKTIILMLPML